MDVEGRRFIEHPPLGGYKTTLNVIPRIVDFVAKCNACGHMKEIERHKLEEVASGQWLPEISRRLRCYACGKKDSKLLTGYYASE
ncbi:hypothetical protein ABK249_02625 [Neorhizobium sp. Rsf11]|uniref:Uncharacterized protein n=1 Tax=Neorhizobium phenanthreniclasticum TaxID=3157917 RepID=A0ABV0LW60_9HYPH